MKVAFLGAPDAGKTKLAQAVARKLGNQWTVVDKYIEPLQKSTGRPFGEITDFVQEIQVLGARWAKEDAAAFKGLHSITCGTIYETIIYATATQGWMAGENALLQDRMYLHTMMQTLGVLQHMTFDYHALFYLPREGEYEHTWATVVDAKLPELLEGCGKVAVTLTGTHKEKVESVISIIQPLLPPSTEDVQ